jgi:hypothetical protein
LEGKDLFQFGFELCDECLFVVFGPFTALRVRIIWDRVIEVGCLEGTFKIVIRNVIVVIVFEEGSPQLLSEAVGLFRNNEI